MAPARKPIRAKIGLLTDDDGMLSSEFEHRSD
jgi:hypothetical protein